MVQTLFIYCNAMSRQLLGAAEVRDTWHVLPFFGRVICLSWRQYSPKGIKKGVKKKNVNRKVRCQTPLFLLFNTEPKDRSWTAGIQSLGLWKTTHKHTDDWTLLLLCPLKTGPSISQTGAKILELHLNSLLLPSQSIKQFSSETISF